MNKNTYKISHFNNDLKVFEADKKEIIFSSFWFMEFGKTCAEIQNSKEELIYSVTKKFQFWKWRMVYIIKDTHDKTSLLISQNSRYTIFKLEIENDVYEIRTHYKKKKSIYKNGLKIAEYDENLSEEKFMKLLTSDSKELNIIFLLYTSLLIGTNHQNSKTILTSQKKLEPNQEPWD
jgi:hypothetical protein